MNEEDVCICGICGLVYDEKIHELTSVPDLYDCLILLKPSLRFNEQDLHLMSAGAALVQTTLWLVDLEQRVKVRNRTLDTHEPCCHETSQRMPDFCCEH